MIRDYLALRGESPDLLPVLEAGGESAESAVLPIATEFRAKLPKAAIEATLATPRLQLDELRTVSAKFVPDGFKAAKIRMPDDYLKLYTLKMDDWKEAVTEPEPEGSLRRQLGRRAPAWMVCGENPMVTEERDAEGVYLRVAGSDAFDLPFTLLYVPVPAFDGETLTISKAAYLALMHNT